MRHLLACFALSFTLACGDSSDDATGGTDGTSTSGTAATSGGGTTATGGSSTTTGGNPMGSAGCGIALAEPTGEWNAKTISVDGATREYFVYLPAGYDPMRPYLVVYQFHGCSSSPDKENNNVPIQDESGGDAIIVRGRAVGDCWDNEADIAFFDAMVGAIESGYCADPERRMAAGYSSGAFMTHYLACVRGAELRGVASIAGGQSGSGCTGDVAALLIHDTDDGTVNISASEGARDQHLDANGCTDATSPFDPSPCVEHQGCEAGLPVVWCQTSGNGHDRQDGLAAPAFWNFLSTL